MSDGPQTPAPQPFWGRGAGGGVPPPPGSAQGAPHSKVREKLPPFSVIVPWKAWLTDRELRSWNTVVFVVLVCAPTAIFVGAESNGTLKSLSWEFALFFAFAWLIILRTIIRPANVHVGALAAVLALAFVIEFPLAVWLERALHAQSSNPVTSIFTIGIPEELAKMLPVAVLAYASRRAWARFVPRDYMFLGAASGLAFGAGEAVGYVYRATQEASSGALSAQGFVLEVVWRLVADPITHAMWAAISCYFIGLAVRHARYRWGLAAFGLAIAAVLHGINDYVAGRSSWIVVSVVSVVLLLAYAHSGDAVDAAVGRLDASWTGPGTGPGGGPGAAPGAAPGAGPGAAPGAAPGAPPGGGGVEGWSAVPPPPPSPVPYPPPPPGPGQSPSWPTFGTPQG